MAIFNNITSESVTQSRLYFYVRVLRQAGIPILFNKTPKLFILYDIVCNICTWMTTAAIIMDLLINAESLETSMETIRVAFPGLLVSLMYGFARWRVKGVARLMILIESLSSEDVEATNLYSGSSSMGRWIPRVKKFVRSFTLFTMYYLPVFTFIRFLRTNETPLPYNTWYPFDISASPALKYTIVFTQFLACYIYSNIIYGFTGLYVTLISIVCVELETLRTNILNISEEQCGSKKLHPVNENVQEEMKEVENKTCEAEANNQEVKFRLMKERLNECIRHHQNILSYIQVMGNTLNTFMAAVFLLQLLSLCVTSFSVITSWGNLGQMFQGVASYLVISGVIAAFCWFGSQISIQTEQVRDAAYGCDWIGAPISLQRSVAMIITMTNKEVVFMAGNFVPVNIKTMMNMINQSLSYFMFLLEVKDKFIEPEYDENNYVTQ